LLPFGDVNTGTILRFGGLVAALMLVPSCSPREAEAPTAQTTVVFAPAETESPREIAVRRFEVTPKSLTSAQQATVHVAVEAGNPPPRLTVDWHGPDGWLAGYQVVDAAAAESTLVTPATLFHDPGRYRAVLRSGTRTLAEDTVVLTAGSAGSR
jgi:hypothetical protein